MAVEQYTGHAAAYAPSAEGRKALSKVSIGGVVYDLKDAAARRVIDEIYADYLRSTDKEALLSAIAAKVSQTDYDTKVAELVAADEALGVRIAEFEAGGELDVVALKGRVTDAEAAINVINGGEAEEGSIKKAIADEVANRNAAIASAIGELDVTDAAVEGQFVTAVSEADGKITVKRAALPAAAEYSLAKEGAGETPEGLAARYYLTKGGAKVGEYIDIAKDQFLKDAVFIASATQADKDIDETVVIGYPYIKFTFQTTGEDKITYVAVKDLVDVYTAGNGINITDNKVSAVVKSGDKYIQVTADGIESKGIDEAISGAVAAEAKRADTAEKANKAAIEAEVTRAKGAEEANATAIAAIKNGTSINSFAGVESALATKAAASDVTDLAGRVTTAERDIDALESGKLDKTARVAGVAFTNDDVPAESLKTALGLGALAYKSSASGVVAGQTISGVKATGTSAGSISVKLDQTKAEATLTKAAYKPAGSITGSAISGGSITVTLKDATAKTEAELGTAKFIPAGTVTAVEGGDFRALKTVALNKSDTGAIQIEGTVSKPAIGLTSEEKTFVTGLTGGKVATFKEGAFTPAAIQDGFYTAGSAATWTGMGYTAPTMGEASKAKFASDGLVASIDETDTEMLVFSAAAKADAVTAQGTFNAGNVDFGTFNGGSATVIDTTKFSGGSKAADSFTANELQGVSTGAVNDVTAAALESAPAFTGAKYNLDTTADTALKTVAFTATNSADIVNKVEYVKQAVDAADFTPVAATLGFAGTEVADLIPTKVEYNAASVNAEGTKFTGAAIELDVGDIVVAEKSVTVE